MNSKTTSASQIETHPYGSLIPKGARAIILGTFPAWEFSHPDRSSIHPERMIDYSYGRIKGPNANYLWRLLAEIYDRPLDSVARIKTFLKAEKIGLTDVYVKIRRKKPGSSSDHDLEPVEYNEKLVSILETNPSIGTVFCTSRNVLKIYHRHFANRVVRKDLRLVVLTSPSASANRAIGSHPEYKRKFAKLEGDRTYAYRLAQYRKYFPLK